MRLIVLFFLLAGTLSVNASQLYSKKLQVLSTIKPIHLIVVELMGDKASAKQLIPDNSSPHDYSFKPSDLRKIKKASLIFRIDEDFESNISPTLENNSSKDKLVSLADAKEIHLLSLKGEHVHNHSKTDAGGIDLHIWTSPTNTIAIANTIVLHLIKQDKENTEIYTHNFEKFKVKMLSTTERIKSELLPFKDTPYAVFNDSWRYFRDFFGLQEPIVINKHEGQSGNIRSIIKMRKKILSNEISCIFSDPSVNPARLNTITENKQINTAVIDILVNNTPATVGAYFTWIETMSISIKDCLTAY